jgi:hypothetical protein
MKGTTVTSANLLLTDHSTQQSGTEVWSGDLEDDQLFVRVRRFTGGRLSRPFVALDIHSRSDGDRPVAVYDLENSDVISVCIGQAVHYLTRIEAERLFARLGDTLDAI